MMEPIFEEMKKDYAGKVKFTVIDADQNPQKVSEFQVLGIPTYVILKEGREVDRIVGYTPKPAFAAHLDKQLAGSV